MHLTHIVVTASVTLSVAGISYAALKPDVLEQRAHVVAEQASCRTVDAAIVAYVAQFQRAPQAVAELRPYVKGDISAYRIDGGVAAGPGC